MSFVSLKFKTEDGCVLITYHNVKTRPLWEKQWNVEFCLHFHEGIRCSGFFHHRWMELNDQLHALTALSPEKESPVPVEWKAGWIPEPVLTLGWRHAFCFCRRSYDVWLIIERLPKSPYQLYSPDCNCIVLYLNVTWKWVVGQSSVSSAFICPGQYRVWGCVKSTASPGTAAKTGCSASRST